MVGGVGMALWTMCEDSQEACSKDPGCYDFFFQDRFVTEMGHGVHMRAWMRGMRWRACDSRDGFVSIRA